MNTYKILYSINGIQFSHYRAFKDEKEARAYAENWLSFYDKFRSKWTHQIDSIELADPNDAGSPFAAMPIR